VLIFHSEAYYAVDTLATSYEEVSDLSGVSGVSLACFENGDKFTSYGLITRKLRGNCFRGIKPLRTSISANADGPRDAASRKIDHIARPTKYNYQAKSVGR